MKQFRSWSDDEQRDFLVKFWATEPRSDERRALVKSSGVTSKDSTNVFSKRARALGVEVPGEPDQKSLALPSSTGKPAAGKHRVFTEELKRRILDRYFGLAKSPERKRLRQAVLNEHGLTFEEIHRWKKGTKWEGEAGAGIATADTVAKRHKSRNMPFEQKLALGREYAAAGYGARSAIGERTGIALGTLGIWAKQAREHDARVEEIDLNMPVDRPRRGRRPKNGRDSAEREDEDGDTGDEPRKKRKSYDRLLQQNLILKGLLKIAEQQGFSVQKLLSFEQE